MPDQGAREVAPDGEALGGEPDRRPDDVGEREPAEPLMRGDEARNDGRRSDRSSPVDRFRQVAGKAEPSRVETVRGPGVEVDAERRPGVADAVARGVVAFKPSYVMASTGGALP